MKQQVRPSYVFYVSLNGNDSWSGRLADPADNHGDGPFATLEQARDTIREIRVREEPLSGPVVVWVRGGVYRRTAPFVLTAEDSGTGQSPTEYRAHLTEDVVIKGSMLLDPAQWNLSDRADRQVWIYPDWRPHHRDLGKEYGQIEKYHGIDQADRRSWSDQLFLNGRIMKQVYRQTDLVPYAFWLSAENEPSELHLQLPDGEDPRDMMMEGSIAEQFFVVKGASYIRIQGFQFTQACNRVQMAVLSLDAATDHCLVEDNKVSRTNGTGLSFSGKNHLIRRNIAEFNSQNGICGSRLRDTLFEHNITRMNNWNRPITHTWESGGGKFADCDHVTLRYHEAASNLGPGIWFDIDNTNIIIEKCRAFHNNYCGIFFEISQGPVLIKDNFCFGNDGAGILVAESNQADVVNNTCAFNQYGVNLRNMLGRSYRDVQHYKLGEITLSHNLIANNHTAGIVNSWEPIDAKAQKIFSSENIFHRNGAIVSWVVENKADSVVASDDWGAVAGGGKPKRVDYHDLDKVQTELGIETGSTIRNPEFVYPNLYELKSFLEKEGFGATSES